MSADATTRFSNRVEDYIRYRPGYPEAIMDFLKTACSLNRNSVVADIGSGTGKSTEMFLKNGYTVYAVEPNAEMRQAAENIYAGIPGFKSINATAEDTGLNDASVNLVVSGQAFHWFDAPKAKKEFLRILKPQGFIALIWNERELNETGFMAEYDTFLINHSTDYQEIDHRRINREVIGDFFAPGRFVENDFENVQIFDFKGLKGRYDSCSYAITPFEPAYQDAMNDLHALFNRYQHDQKVRMVYTTKVFLGQFAT